MRMMKNNVLGVLGPTVSGRGITDVSRPELVKWTVELQKPRNGNVNAVSV